MPTLRHKLTLQTNTPAQSASGAKSDSWADTATVWGNLRPVQSMEVVAGQQTQTATTHILEMRYRTLNTRQRFTYGTRTFAITGITNGLAGKRDTTERGTWLTVQLRENA